MPHDDKYVSFKRADFLDFIKELTPTSRLDLNELILNDAVVIRKQDVFAPPALDAYANSIQAACEVLTHLDDADPEKLKRLRSIADYFHRQATEAWDTDRKLPD